MTKNATSSPTVTDKDVLVKTLAENQKALRAAGTSQDPVTIREATFDDYDEIAALHIRNGLTTRSYEDWMSFWRNNPVYKQHQGQWPIGWVLEIGKGRLVGSIGSVPMAYHFRGRELRAAATCSWVVDSGYRGYSMPILDRVMKHRDVDCFVCTTVSSASEACYGLFQWAKAPAGTWDKSAFWITNYHGFVKSVLHMKSIPQPEFISYPISTALLWRDRFMNAGMRTSGAASEIELCAGFDSRFDDFWAELKSQNQNVFLAHRTQEALSWHFRYSQERQAVWILTASKGSRLTAYAVFDRQDNPISGLKRVRLVDFQSLKGHEGAILPALEWMLRRCREEGIHILENAGCWLERLNLPRIYAPSHRTLNSWTFYYRATNQHLREALKDPAVWAPSSFDGDVSL
jgi:hypothetical protein